jgi:hypothetical protein
MTLTNKQQFFKKNKIPADASLSLEEIATIARMPLRALKEVDAKARGAYSTNINSVRLKSNYAKNVVAPRSQKLSINQWAFARVYAFVNKSKKVFYGADRHIAEKYNL